MATAIASIKSGDGLMNFIEEAGYEVADEIVLEVLKIAIPYGLKK